MSQSTIRAEFGAWIEGDTARKDGKGMRKVWVSPAPVGARVKLAVIATRESREVHMLALDVSEPAYVQDALVALTLGIEALAGLASVTQAPAPKAPARKPTQAPPAAPTPITRVKAPVAPVAPVVAPTVSPDRAAVIQAARDARAKLTIKAPVMAPVTAPAIPAADWFANLMHDAGAV